MAVCKYHSDRQAIGVCMRCRAVICSACCTRVEGVNHCHACLQRLGRRDSPRRSGGTAATLGAVFLLSGAWLALFGVLWLCEGRLAP
jgi:hypothetical protein